MPGASVGRDGIVVSAGKRTTTIPWESIRSWSVAGTVRSGSGVVASVMSIAYAGNGNNTTWLHLGNRALGESGFVKLARELHKRLPGRGPKKFNPVPPHVAAKQEKAQWEKAQAGAGAWPKFDRLGGDREELMRRFVRPGAVPSRRRKALPAATRRRIEALAERGARLEKENKLADAWAVYGEAFGLIPEPRINWGATPWVLTVAADVAFRAGQFARALGMLNDAVNCTAPDVNPFVNLRMGECLYELGDRKRAAHHLTLAYMAEGRDVFADEDPKYFKLLEKVLKPPKGHKHL